MKESIKDTISVKSPSNRSSKPIKSALKQVLDPTEVLLNKIKALDTTFRLADEILIDNNRLSSENVALKE